jgi:uncharacterized protein (TIGR02284 family)
VAAHLQSIELTCLRHEEDVMAERSEHDVMNHLIETCRDAEQGLRLAAERVTDPSLKRLFNEMSAQRAAFANELLPHAQRLGGNAAGDGTATGAIHRRWIDLKSTVLHNDHAVVAEVQRGESVALQAYFEAVNGMLPPDARDLVQHQCDELSDAHVRIGAYEHKG